MWPVVVLKFGSSKLRSAADLPDVVDEVYRHLRSGKRVVAVVRASNALPAAYESKSRLFNPSTTFSFAVPQECDLRKSRKDISIAKPAEMPNRVTQCRNTKVICHRAASVRDKGRGHFSLLHHHLRFWL